ncbi:MAG: class I SAM-dependent methyltransferase [Candidatus Cloacimonetes bacterium]|nr:class I SAM-dependent methyltransferase [Candidatus Cloacimonadota bacterium]
MENYEVIKKESDAYWEKVFKNSDYDFFKLAKSEQWLVFINELKQKKVKTVLDMGCGGGHWSIVLARAGFQVTSVDISETAIKNLNEWKEREYLNTLIETKICSLEKYYESSEKEKYDLVICNSVLDHIIIRDVKNSHKLLNSNGYLYLSFDEDNNDDKKSFKTTKDNMRKYTKGEYSGMLWKYYSEKEIKKLLEHKFSIEKFVVTKKGRRQIWAKKLKI